MIFWIFSIYIVDRLSKYMNWRLLITLVTAICLLSGHFNIPFDLTRVVTFYPFFVSGYFFRMFGNNSSFFKEKTKAKKGLCIFILSVLFVCVFYFSNCIKDASLWQNQSFSAGGYTIFDRIVYWALAALIICLLIEILGTTQSTYSWMKYLGRNTLGIFLLHPLPFWILSFIGINSYIINSKYSMTFAFIEVVVAAIFNCIVFSNSIIRKIDQRMKYVWERLFAIK